MLEARVSKTAPHSFCRSCSRRLISLELIVNVEVQADEEYEGDQEGHKCEEDQLLEKTGFL